MTAADQRSKTMKEPIQFTAAEIAEAERLYRADPQLNHLPLDSKSDGKEWRRRDWIDLSDRMQRLFLDKARAAKAAAQDRQV